MRPDFDIVVAGAGIVGATLAALLARHPSTQKLSVAIIDATEGKKFDRAASVGLRVSALSRASQNILDNAGAWTLMPEDRLSAYREMRVWDAQGDNCDDPEANGLHFDCALLGEPDLGHIVENDLVSAALHDAISGSSSIQQLRPAQLTGASFGEDSVSLTVSAQQPGVAEKKRVLTTSLLVGCDGATSKVRDLAGIQVHEASYGQCGVVAVVSTSLPHRETAWQRFLPDGPIAFLPLANGQSSIVWSVSDNRAAELLTAGEVSFERAVSEACNGVLGSVKLESKRASFPLRRLHAKQYCRNGIVLAGDAAHVVHPLAGQGANLGLLDVAALVDIIADATTGREAPGDLRVLRRYERWRKGENLAMIAALDGLSKLFSSSRASIKALRRAGMAAIARTPAARNQFARHALGLSGELPESARSRLKQPGRWAGARA